MFTSQQSPFGGFKPPEQPQQSPFGGFKPPEQPQQFPFGGFKPPEQPQQFPFGGFKPPEQNIDLRFQELNTKIDNIFNILSKKNTEEKNTEKHKKYVISKIHNHPLVETKHDKEGIEYKNGFYCDICAYVQQKEEYFYHCEECYNAKSKKLFDVCSDCIRKQLA